MHSSTAILLFSRTAQAEAKYKQLVRAETDNIALLERMLARTKQLLRQSQLPVYHISEREQRGHSFGDRLANAVASVFRQGHDKLLIVGQDCAQLQRQDIRQALSHLDNGHAVLGRDHRDGAYLIGLHREQFSRDTFAELPWQQVGLYAALKAFLCQSVPADSDRGLHLCQPKELRALADLNTAKDLATQLPWLRTDRFLAAILARINRPANTFTHTTFLSSLAAISTYQLRGPPVL
ncbi:MAG: DUF2064 domain-containing protein [Bacteroidota bacterium]